MKTLKTKAICNHGRQYNVAIGRGDLGWYLNIVGTPGNWYIDTLLGLGTGMFGGEGIPLNGDDRKLAIMGDEWLCVNIQALLREAVAELIYDKEVAF